MANFNDNSVYGNAPSEIGDVLHVTSIEAATMGQLIKKVILFVLILLVPVSLFVIWMAMSGKSSGAMVLALAFSILGIYRGRKAFKVSFEGADYFLGKNGFSVIRFNKTRDNITDSQTVLFKDIAFLMSGKTENKSALTNLGNEFYFTFYNKASETGTYVYGIAYSASNIYAGGKNSEYSFWQKVEQQWTAFFLNEQRAEEVVYFPILKDETLYPKEISVGRDYIDISGTRYDCGCIKDIHFNNETCTFEHVNHSISIMHGFVEEGDMSTIKLSELGNRNALFELLSARGITDGIKS